MARNFALILLSSFVIFGCSSNTPVQEHPTEVPASPPAGDGKIDVWGWDYQGARGPEAWGQLNAQYEMCASGQMQSPINLVWSKPVTPNPVTIAYKDSEAVINNTGYTYRIELTPQSQITYAGKDYILEKIEIRTPSEHQLSGKTMPMELQFYHRSSNGLKQAIISLFVVKGRGSPWFDKLWEMATPVAKFKSSGNFPFNPDQLIPPKQTFYHYEGSLTHPPCLEGVQWFVFNTPLQLSEDQIAKVRSMYDNNFRPIQPTNGRKITNF